MLAARPFFEARLFRNHPDLAPHREDGIENETNLYIPIHFKEI